MKYNKDIKQTILEYSATGISGRRIAKILGLSKSAVNEFLAKQSREPNDKRPENTTIGPRILVLDVETAATTAYVFGRFNINLSQANIKDEGGWILCASWHWLGSEQIHSIWLTPEEVMAKDDSKIVEQLHELYSVADAMVAHNGCSFDHKVIQTRVVAQGLKPLPVIKILDTLLLAKRYLRLPSNKLDSIGEYFQLGRKISNSGITMWKEVQEGSVKAMADMVKYCQQDVELLTEVYYKLRNLGTAGNAFNAALYYQDDVMRCSVCGSTDVSHTHDTVKTSVSEFDLYQCNECGARQRGRKNLVIKTKRKALLTTAA